jgi:hypothetical protein
MKGTKLEAILSFCFLQSLTTRKMRKFVTRKLYWNHFSGRGSNRQYMVENLKLLLC